MSPEGLETFVFLVFLGLMLLQLIVRWARGARARARQAPAPEGGWEQQREPEPAWPPPVKTAPPPAGVPRPTSAPARTAPRAAAVPRPGARLEAAAAARALRHGNRAALRRAFVLATVLGPPRALADERTAGC